MTIDSFLKSTTAHGASQLVGRMGPRKVTWCIICLTAYTCTISGIAILCKKYMDPTNVKTTVSMNMLTRNSDLQTSFVSPKFVLCPRTWTEDHRDLHELQNIEVERDTWSDPEDEIGPTEKIPPTMVQNSSEMGYQIAPYLMTHERGSECTVIQVTLKFGQKYSTVPRAQERVSERASERVSAAERASEASSAEQANE